MLIRIDSCGECPANGESVMTVSQCMIYKPCVDSKQFRWRKAEPNSIPSWCPLREREIGEAKSQPCPTCIARRGIDKCRPDEELHVTHYTAEEMNMDPLPDKPCECGNATMTKEGSE